MKGKSGDFASLYTSDQLQYLGVREVNQYVVYSYKMFSRPQSNQVEIVIKVDQNLIDNNKHLFLQEKYLDYIYIMNTYFQILK